jgi:hypothetical protein
VKAVVGGRDFEFERDDVVCRMRGVAPEPIREHLVEVDDDLYPPKQVVATLTGWPRTSFTTMEAQRVLTKLGFRCRRAGASGDTTVVVADRDVGHSVEARVSGLETAVEVVQAALADVVRRLRVLDAA